MANESETTNLADARDDETCRHGRSLHQDCFACCEDDKRLAAIGRNYECDNCSDWGCEKCQ